jgi:hypothetical protein
VGLYPKGSLIKFWQELSNDEKRKRIIGKIGDLIEDVLIRERERKGRLDYQKPLSTLLELVGVLGGERLSGIDLATRHRAVLRRTDSDTIYLHRESSCASANFIQVCHVSQTEAGL